MPVPFFANLLWQESRLRDDDISKKGAHGYRAIHAENRGRNRTCRSVRPDAGDPCLGALFAAAAPAIRQSGLCRRRLQCRRAPRDRVAGASRQPAARNPQLCRARHRTVGRSLEDHADRQRCADLRAAPAMPQPAGFRQCRAGTDAADRVGARQTRTGGNEERESGRDRTGIIPAAARASRPKRT